ncbi:MAG: tetratricopeptide repeat protein [Candidatus Cloacimonetes bacterium]|nr:tetratricopeptide repeat protein [Candidatus Cloacimonadota bacterium]
MSNTDKKKRVSIFKHLWQRRVPQVFGIYLGICWGIIEFVGSLLVDRFMLSPYLINFSLVTLLSLIPTVLIISYFHGKPGKDKWTKTEKIFIPANLIISIVVLFVMFYGKDLGAVTKTVTIENEEGLKIERVIPKSEFRKKIVIFFFENESADSTLNWLQYAISSMIKYDLSQDIFLEIYSGYGLYEKTKEAGFSQGIGLPLTLKRKIANYYHLNYFVSGSYVKQNGVYSVKTFLHKTKTGKLLIDRTFKGADIFKLVDEMSLQLKYDLEIPKSHIEETKDLPVSEILTNSIPALKMFTYGLNAVLFDNDYENAINNLEQAIKDDPTFAFAHVNLWEMFINANQSSKAEKSIQNVMQYIYKIPETYQFIIKYSNYFLNQEPDKAFAVLKMWVELYPDDISAHSRLAEFYLKRNQMDEAILEYKYILELDPEEFYYLKKIGSIYKRKGEFEEALKYYKQYAEQFPEDYSSYTTIGDLYDTMGEYDKAKSYYEKALILEPGNISILRNLANFEIYKGNFEEALSQYESALNLCKIPKDRAEIFGALQSFYNLKGQINKSIEYSNLKFAEKEKFVHPVQILLDKFYGLDKYIQIGKKDIAFHIIENIESQLAPPFDKFIAIGKLYIFIELEDVNNAEKEIKGVELCIKNFGFEMLRSLIFYAKGKIHEIRGEYEQAILMYQKGFELQPTEVSVNMEIGRCYRKMREYKKAEKYIQKTLKILPFYPKAHYELALLYADVGKKEKALEHLRITLETWKDADPEYKPAQKAREKMKEWEESSGVQ